MTPYPLAIFGASSLVGQAIVKQWCLDQHTIDQSDSTSSDALFSADTPHQRLAVFSRKTPLPFSYGHVDAYNPGKPQWPKFTQLICVAPIWTLLDYLDLIHNAGCTRMVVVSSTSRFSKAHSWHDQEKALAQRIQMAEQSIIDFAHAHQMDWIILRPTLIYGHGQDQNISKIAMMIKRLRFFVVLNQGKGLRQPVHCDDVAMACVSSMKRATLKNLDYNLSGGETLSYKDMVGRIFNALNYPIRIISIPHQLFFVLSQGLYIITRRQFSVVAMILRMNEDLVFDDPKARQDFGFKPRPFLLSSGDLP